MDPRAPLRQYIDSIGGIDQAVITLGAAEATLRSVLNGWRGVSRAQARAWDERSGGALLADQLVWIAPTKREVRAKKKPRRKSANQKRNKARGRG